MDDKGYAFTPLTLLLIIPVIIIAADYGGIIGDVNQLSLIVVGGDVTYDTTTSIYSAIQQGAGDAGRNSAYNATRTIIDRASLSDPQSSFLNDSKGYVKGNIISMLNSHVIETAQKLETQTGRNISINGKEVNNYTDNDTTQLFTTNDVQIVPTDPFSFDVVVRGGIPMQINQSGQIFNVKTPEIRATVSLNGIEDPYIWINSKYRRESNVIYPYPYYSYSNLGAIEYHFADKPEDKNLTNTSSQAKLHNLWECLNGTNNPSNISRPYYFPNPNGLSFFERLEGHQGSDSNNTKVRISTFILGDPLSTEHSGSHISCLDSEYYNSTPTPGYPITVGGLQLQDPEGTIFYLSNSSMTTFGIVGSYP